MLWDDNQIADDDDIDDKSQRKLKSSENQTSKNRKQKKVKENVKTAWSKLALEHDSEVNSEQDNHDGRL